MINMATTREAQRLFAVLCLFLTTLVPTVEAFDGGDAVALLLGMTITVVGFCACLGWYARRRNGQF
ncbi:small integral membrane protein 30-like [Colossoma macropomum]|uniref:small integral membrane protein 30-like n=1 Tax=Colossoma macropomum TaxID=42526 RepID=UPI0018643664|nr:small integral membrane protein 30-like [Colossoma macropomum]